MHLYTWELPTTPSGPERDHRQDEVWKPFLTPHHFSSFVGDLVGAPMIHEVIVTIACGKDQGAQWYLDLEHFRRRFGVSGVVALCAALRRKCLGPVLA